MAYDNKRLKTFKWLESVQKDYHFPLMIYSGSIYAANEIMIAKVDYPEFYHLSDFEWCEITHYTDDDGYLLKMPEIEVMKRQFHNNRYFDDMFCQYWHRLECALDPKYMRKALKPFEINNIHPNMVVNTDRIELSGHNHDVSIRVMFMGVNK